MLSVRACAPATALLSAAHVGSVLASSGTSLFIHGFWCSKDDALMLSGPLCHRGSVVCHVLVAPICSDALRQPVAKPSCIGALLSELRSASSNSISMPNAHTFTPSTSPTLCGKMLFVTDPDNCDTISETRRSLACRHIPQTALCDATTAEMAAGLRQCHCGNYNPDSLRVNFHKMHQKRSGSTPDATATAAASLSEAARYTGTAGELLWCCPCSAMCHATQLI